LSTIPAFVARAGHGGKVSAAAGTKAPAGGQDPFAQALGQKPRQAGSTRPQPAAASTADEAGPRDAKPRIADAAQPQTWQSSVAATNGKADAIAQLAALLDTRAPMPAERRPDTTSHEGKAGKSDIFPADRQTDATAAPADRAFGQNTLNTLTVLAGMKTSDLSVHQGETQKPGIETADTAPEQEGTDIDIPHNRAAFERRGIHSRTVPANAAALDQLDETSVPEASFPHPGPAQDKTEATDTDHAVEQRTIPLLPGMMATPHARQVAHGEPEDGSAAAETGGRTLPDLGADASDRHREEPIAAVVPAQALPAEPRRAAALPTAKAEDRGTDEPRNIAVEPRIADRNTGVKTPPALAQTSKVDAPTADAPKPDAALDAEARKQPAQAADASATATPNDDTPRNTTAVPERAPAPPARPAAQEPAPQRADIRPRLADDGNAPAPRATVDIPREERASPLPDSVRTAEPLAGRVTVLPTPAAPVATVPMSPAAAALVTAFAAEASPPQALHEAALAAHAARPAAPVTLQTLKIQLQPAELGLVTARLTVDGEKIAVDLQVETTEARHRMAADSDQIVQALRGMGFDIDRVTVQQSHAAGGPGAETRNQPGGFASQENHGSDAGERRSGGTDRGRDNDAAHDRQGPAGGTGGDAARSGSLYI